MEKQLWNTIINDRLKYKKHKFICNEIGTSQKLIQDMYKNFLRIGT